jgi:hypothetical protein
MTRLPLAMLILAGAAIAQPAAAQDTGPVGPANEKINQVIVYGNDKCPEANGDEILVCAVLPEGDRYRVPQIFRGGDPLDPRNEAWVNRVVSLQRVGRFGTDSCSPVGLGGFTGCTQQLLAGAKAERQAADKTDWQAMIADERAKQPSSPRKRRWPTARNRPKRLRPQPTHRQPTIPTPNRYRSPRRADLRHGAPRAPLSTAISDSGRVRSHDQG